MSFHSLPWYHIPGPLDPLQDRAVLDGEEWHHSHQVLRMGVGESIIVFDGLGVCLEGVIVEATRSEGHIKIVADRSSDFDWRRPFTLSVAFAPTKNIDRTEFAIEKLVEIGVDEIILLDCTHAERSHIRVDRMQKLIRSAAKQSRKIRLPHFRDFITPNLLVSQYLRAQPEADVYCCHLGAHSTPLVQNDMAWQHVLILIGPEGGFTNEEVDQIVLRGAKMVSLGPYRLRVETAVVVACATIHTLYTMKNSL